MTFWKSFISKHFPQKHTGNRIERESAQTETPSIFNPANDYAKYLREGILPRYYKEGLNCYLDSINDASLRQAVYEDMLMTPGSILIDITREAGSLFGIKDFKTCLNSHNNATRRLNKPEMAAYKIPKKSLIRMMLEGSSIEMTFFFKQTELASGRKVGHAESARVTDIVLKSQAFFERGFTCHKNGELEQALDWYNRAIRSEALDARAWLNKGSLLAARGKYRGAVRCFDKVLEIAPKMARGRVYVEKAKTLSKLKKYKKVIECYDKALEIDPKRDDWWNNEAVALSELKRYEEAVECLNKAIELMPLSLRLWGNKMLFLYSLGKYEKVIECCDKMLDIDPKFAGAFVEKGMAFNKLNRYTQALECYDKALEMDPEIAEAWINKAETFKKLKRYPEALECYDKSKKYSRWKCEEEMNK